jgi:hypothetical protein
VARRGGAPARGSIAGGLRKLRGSNRSSARTCNLCCVARKSRKLAPSKLVRGRRPVAGCAAPCATCHIRRPGLRRPVAGAGSQRAGDEAGQSIRVVAAGLRSVAARGGDKPTMASCVAAMAGWLDKARKWHA